MAPKSWLHADCYNIMRMELGVYRRGSLTLYGVEEWFEDDREGVKVF